ncbi:MAG: Stk1 family PASTA domain-containing Ser/Thr kinase [Lawsonella sp.]
MISGRLNGRYELGDVLGYGGMSEVRSARDTLLNRDVAIKILRADLARDQNFLERFRREARNSASLNHPNIVAIYDTGESVTKDGTISYIVMEKLGGPTLRDIIANEGKLDQKEALRTIAKVANALDYSHQMGIIHRDIKPGNIMLTVTGVPKVMDFGISRAADDMQQLTQTATVFGTAQYISPEHAMGHNIDYRADIYALGCVLYECLTGKPPFEAETAVAVACKHVQDDVMPPSSINPDISPELDDVVMKALAKHPEDRYQNSGDFQEAIEEVLGETVATKVVLPDYQQMGATLAADDNPTEALVLNTSILQLPESGKVGDAQAVVPDAVTTGELPVVEASGEAGEDAPAWRQFLVPGSGGSGDEATEDGAKKGKKGDKRKVKASTKVLLSLVAILALLLGGTGIYFGLVQNPEINIAAADQMEDFKGREAEPIYKSLDERGYTVTVRVDYIRTQTHGTIVRTNPAAGSRVTKETPITLYVATGGEPIKVPNVSGMEPDEARLKLELTGIPVESATKKKPSDEDDEGKVVGTSVKAGKKIDPNKPIQLYIGSGKRPVKVPDVVGMKANEATELLKKEKLKVRRQTVASSRPAGEVLRLEGAGDDLSEGDTVTLVVSDGTLIIMPDLVNSTVAGARTRLRAAGWEGQLNESRTGTLNLARINRVAKQYPAAGSEVPKDAPVSVTVYELNLP